MIVGVDGKKRCFGGQAGKEFYGVYHDAEWGIPQHDDRKLFELLILEGAQAGLSWETILKRREGYRAAFYNFDPVRVAAMSDRELDALMNNTGIIRNRLKIYSTRQIARIYLKIQQEFDSFDAYLWQFASKKQRNKGTEIPVRSLESDALSKDLKKRGMSFVGSTIMYAYMQAIGMVNDHAVGCWRYEG